MLDDLNRQDVMARLCDPCLTLDEARGEFGPVFVPDVWDDDEEREPAPAPTSVPPTEVEMPPPLWRNTGRRFPTKW